MDKNLFLAFYGDYYYPNGGIEDLIDTFDSFEAAKNAIELAHENRRPEDVEHKFDFGNIYNVLTGEKTILF